MPSPLYRDDSSFGSLGMTRCSDSDVLPVPTHHTRDLKRNDLGSKSPEVVLSVASGGSVSKVVDAGRSEPSQQTATNPTAAESRPPDRSSPREAPATNTP